MIALGGLVHAAVMVLPLLVFGGNMTDTAMLVFFAGATALYLGDAATMHWTPSRSSSPLDMRAQRWAAVTGVVLLVLFWTCLAERALMQPAGSWLQCLGGSMLFAGAFVRGLAVRTLGRQFRTEIEQCEGELVRDGIYRITRHPSETGLLGASLGAAILLQSTVGLMIWCWALVPVTLARLSLEERALIDRFGSAYERYTFDVGRLLPRRT